MDVQHRSKTMRPGETVDCKIHGVIANLSSKLGEHVPLGNQPVVVVFLVQLGVPGCMKGTEVLRLADTHCRGRVFPRRRSFG